MSRAHITLLSSLLVAILALPAEAQTPTDSAAADTATAAPKKKSRFGGIMNKAKQVAGNKAIQDAAKGAATGVACTVVPGAAVVSAATGKGPCANSGLVGMVTGEGGIKGAATAMASGMAGGAAAKAAAKVTGSGGAKGAAAAGALQAVTGQGGLTQAAAMAAAQAAAGRMATGAAATALKKGASTKTAMPAGADMAGAMAAMGAAGAAMGNMTAGMAKVATVDFRELKALLPESIRGMKRTEATGQTQGAMGIQISSAEGSYSSDDGKSVKLTIADIGSVAGFAGAAAYAWTTTEVDRETAGGYEKTTTFKGYKALEKFDRQNKSAELSVLVGERFVVGAEGDNVDIDAVKAALGGVDLRKLAGMKGKGAK